MAGSPARSERRPLEELQTVVDLLGKPTLARVYGFVLRDGPVTVTQVVETLDVPQGTAYDYVERLETARLVERVNDQRPFEYDADAIELTLSTDGERRTITPALVAAVARRGTDEDVDVFVERHGLDGLAAALEYADEYVDGTVNHRIAARELDISPLEAEVILQALEPVAKEYDVAG
jgi:DNA-binding MarR family transcriptional regulator